MKTKLFIYIFAICLLCLSNVSFGQAPNLGTTSTFAAFTAVGAFTNTGASIVTGDVGTNVGAFSAFPPGTLIGQKHVADVVSAAAATDVALAYSDLASRTCGSVISTTLGSGQTLTPGVYCLGAASTLNGNLILDATGNPTGIFIFKIDGALSTTTLSTVSLVSTSACNVFWQVNGQVQLGAGSTFQGTILANGAITLLEAAQLTGRALSQAGAISLNNNIVNVVTSPIASTITGPTTLCAGGSIVLSGNVGGTWNTGATTPTITVTTSGDYFVTNTTNCGSATSNHIVVTLSAPPVASIIAGPTALCGAASIVLSGNVGGTWSTGATTPTITVTTPGDYYVTNANGCGSVISNHIVVTLSAPPVASTITGPTALCGAASIVLSGNVGGTWNTGATTPTITVTTAGDYFVTNTTNCGSVTSNHIVVKLSASPVASIITGPTALCGAASIVLSGNVGGTWSTGATTPTITVTTPGDYYVTNANGCGSVISNHIVVTLSAPPVASTITGPTALCGAASIVLSGNVGGTWNTGATTPTITVTTPGDYYVTNANGCGSVISNHIVVTLSASPVASIITGPTALCGAASIVLSGNVGGTWSTGATTPTITVTTPGDYYVTNANGCGSVISNHIVVTLSAPPVASLITGPTALCGAASIVLSGNVGGTWNTGATTPTITVTTPGDYYVTNTTNCGSATSNHIVVKVNAPPVASIITGPTAICGAGSIVLAGNVGGTWNTGATTPTITVTKAGDYYVTNTNGCGSVTSNHIEVTVNQPPVAAIIVAKGPTTFCAPGSVVLTANVCGRWNTGVTTASIIVTKSGDYYITITNACGSVTSNHIIVTVNPLPVASIITANGPTEFCGCGKVILCGNVGGTWNTGATTSCITVTKAGDYFVTNKNACGSVTSNHIVVTFSQKPVASFITAKGGIEICECTQVILSGNVGGTWNTGATSVCITVTKAGDYYVTNTNACGTVTSNHIKVTNGQKPIASRIIANGSTAFCGCRCNKVVLSGNVGGTWNTGATSACITVTQVGDYYVTNTNACGSVTSNHITITKCPKSKGANGMLEEESVLDTVNVSQVSYNDVSIYPNPSTTSFNIDLVDISQFEKIEFKLYNAIGVNLMNETLIEKVTNIKTRNFDSGFYFYRLIDKDKVIKSGILLFKK